MTFDADYRCDAEFSKLLARRSDVDLTVAALELARDAYPDLDFSPTLTWIAEAGKKFAATSATAKNDHDMLRKLAGVIAGCQGITGDTETYDDPDNSYLHRVIERKRGIPISLSVLYMAVAKQAGITLQGVAAPAHFLTRFEAVDGPLFLDAFHGGCLLRYDDAVKRIRETAGYSTDECEAALEPVSARKTVMRMLNNLKMIYTKNENWPAAWVVQHRLLLLQPGSYGQRRDLGLIALKANRLGQAIDMLTCCLKNCPSEETGPLTAQLNEARRLLTQWN